MISSEESLFGERTFPENSPFNINHFACDSSINHAMQLNYFSSLSQKEQTRKEATRREINLSCLAIIHESSPTGTKLMVFKWFILLLSRYCCWRNSCNL